MSAAAQPLAGTGRRRDTTAELARWWPLAALTLLAAVLRLSTLGLQSFWYDEAFTVVRDLHPGLVSTLHSVVHTENNPPLWYLIAWADARVLGTGAIALRLPSALCGIALVPVAWGIGAELGGRRPATLMAALVAVNPLYVWYSQEARPYGLYVFTAGLAILCFVRADRVPTRGRMALFALTAVLAMLSHYFAVFLVAGMLVWLVRAPGRAPAPGAPRRGGGGARRARAAAAGDRPGRTRHAVDRALGALQPPAGDPAVLPDRLHRLGARTRGRAARRPAGAGRAGDRRARARGRVRDAGRTRARGAGGDAGRSPGRGS